MTIHQRTRVPPVSSVVPPRAATGSDLRVEYRPIGEPVPVIRLSHLSEARRRAHVIADNRPTELAGWDKELPVLELGELFEVEIDFHAEVAGFDLVDFERLIAGDDGPPFSADDVPPEPEAVTISRSRCRPIV